MNNSTTHAKNSRAHQAVEDFYHEAVNQAKSAQIEVEQYSGELLDAIKKNPLKSVLFAGGVGFILAALLKR